MGIILSNLSDERLAELSNAIHAERKRRFFEKDWSHIKDNPGLSGVDRVKFIRDNNPGFGFSEALWLVGIYS